MDAGLPGARRRARCGRVRRAAGRAAQCGLGEPGARPRHRGGREPLDARRGRGAEPAAARVREARRLVEDLPGDRLGLIAFAGKSYILSPLTVDGGAVEMYLDALDPDIASEGGTNLSAVLRQGAELLTATRDGADRVLVVFTDGEAHDSLDDALVAARALARQGITLILVAEGGTEPVRIPDPRPERGAAGVQAGRERRSGPHPAERRRAARHRRGGQGFDGRVGTARPGGCGAGAGGNAPPQCVAREPHGRPRAARMDPDSHRRGAAAASIPGASAPGRWSGCCSCSARRTPRRSARRRASASSPPASTRRRRPRS